VSVPHTCWVRPIWIYWNRMSRPFIHVLFLAHRSCLHWHEWTMHTYICYTHGYSYMHIWKKCTLIFLILMSIFNFCLILMSIFYFCFILMYAAARIPHRWTMHTCICCTVTWRAANARYVCMWVCVCVCVRERQSESLSVGERCTHVSATWPPGMRQTFGICVCGCGWVCVLGCVCVCICVCVCVCVRERVYVCECEWTIYTCIYYTAT